MSFAMLLYPIGGIEWARGNDQTYPSSVGFDAGDTITFTNVEGSGTETSILTLDRRSNAGIEGLYIFRVDSEIEDGQCEESAYTITDDTYWPCIGKTFHVVRIIILL